MRKSSKIVSLVLITSVLASCNNEEEVKKRQEVYMRADESAPYTNTTQQVHHNHNSGMSNALLWYMAFSSMSNNSGSYNNGYAQGVRDSRPVGYASAGLSHQSTVGTNSAKAKAFEKSPYASSNSVSGKTYKASQTYSSTSKSSSVSRGGFGSSSSRNSVSS